MRTYHIPVFVPHNGCPHDCVFCNQRHITGHTEDTKPEEVKKIIEDHLSTLDENYYAEIAFFGGSFTAIEFDLQKSLLEAAYPYVQSGKIQGIRCSTRPDCINEEILDNYIRYGGRCIELGVQSTDKEVLNKSRRGHSFEDVISAATLIKSKGLELGVQMMLGLPGDTKEKMIKTASDLIALKPSCVRIYPTLVVKDTGLYQMYAGGNYTPLDVEGAVDILSIVMPMFERAGVEIIRVGLQTTDEINETNVIGPYHPAIRELAEGRIIRNIILENVNKESGVIEVFCHPSRVSRVVGHSGCNKAYFKANNNITLKAVSSKEMNINELKICDKIVAIY